MEWRGVDLRGEGIVEHRSATELQGEDGHCKGIDKCREARAECRVKRIGKAGCGVATA